MGGEGSLKLKVESEKVSTLPPGPHRGREKCVKKGMAFQWNA